jgi:hypothetical protein
MTGCHNGRVSPCLETRAPGTEDIAMKIGLISVYVDDQEKALRFYTEVWAS